MIVELSGQIERITYTNEENGYTIARLKVNGYNDLVTVVGTLMAPAPGEILNMKGEWVNHPKYGDQFKIVSHKTSVPASIYGIQKYLGSGLIKGIGPVMAKRITKRFGEKTLDVIDRDIEMLERVDGIGSKRINMIQEAWDDQKDIRGIMLFLQTHGVSSGYAAKIFKKYKNHSIDVVKKNPYRLAADIFGIGFVTADGIADKLGFPRDSELRARAGILYVLNQLSDEGHVYFPYDSLVTKCQEMLQMEREVVVKGLDQIVAEKKVIFDSFNKRAGHVNSRAVFLTKFHVAEIGIGSALNALMRAPKSIRNIDADRAVEWVQKQLSIILADKQITAVRDAIVNKVLVVTGGPGTGKTTIIHSIIKILSKLNIRIMLAAPTGRAAKRMSETTGREAKTIHRLLEFSLKKGGFDKNEDNPLECELLILDEASMIDTMLMYHLLKAVPQGATLILVGDVNQLPSVGAGNVLKDIISSDSIPVVELNEIFRQARESLIIVNAHEVNNGKMPSFERKGPEDDFYFIEQEDPQEVLQTILELTKERIPGRFGFDPFNDIQVLTPMNKGMIGARNLNDELQKELNPGESGLTRASRVFRVDDKVMQIKNNYDKEVFNGDIGRIVKIDSELQEVFISFDGRRVVYDYSEFDEVALAYAISVHKSQGSEYPAVIMPVLTQHYMLLQRNLLYTGITRGRKLVVLVGTKKALSIGINNDKTDRRYTLLKERIRLYGNKRVL
ncbi:ATP-dependent RecD-like DNA helicase [Thermodesulfobacteriota bacterium]